jgi:hypothetical protein
MKWETKENNTTTRAARMEERAASNSKSSSKVRDIKELNYMYLLCSYYISIM